MVLASPIDVIRSVLVNWVFPCLRLAIPSALSVIGILFCYYGIQLWLAVVQSITIDSFYYLTNLVPIVSETNLIAIGWLALVITIWSYELNMLWVRNMWMLAIVPLTFTLIKFFVICIVPAKTFDPFALKGWLEIMKDPNVVLAFKQFCAIGDLCQGTMLVLLNAKFKRPRFGAFGMSILLLVTLYVSPLALLAFVIYSAVHEWWAVPLFVSLIAAAVMELGSPEQMFQHFAPIVLGWIGVLFSIISIKSSLSRLLFVFGVIVPAINYIKVFIITLQRHDNWLSSLSSLSDWISSVQDPYVACALLAHMFIICLGIAVFIVEHFAKSYVLSDKFLGKFFLLLDVITTAAFPPLGLMSYIIFFWFVPQRLARGYQAPPAILDSRQIHFGENLPDFPRFVFYVGKAIAGICTAFLLLFMYVAFVVFTYYYSFFVPVWESPKHTNPTFRQFAAPSLLVPPLIRNLSGQMRVSLYSIPKSKRGLWWNIKFFVLQFAAIVEIAPNATQPNSLSGALASQFGPVFPFADGIAVADRNKVKEYLSDKENRKGPRSLAGPASLSQAKFSLWSTITMGLSPPDEGVKVIAARKVLAAWLKEFDFAVGGTKNPTFASMTSHFPPLRDRQLPPDSELFGVFGDVLYWMATPSVSPCNHSTEPVVVPNHGMMSRAEKASFLELVNNLFQFFPSWFNFVLLGGFFERQVNAAFYSMRDAIYRDKGAAYQAAMDVGRAEGIPDSEILRLIVSVFAIAGAAVPSNLLAKILKRIAADPANMCKLYKADKETFIKECARLDPAVFWVNVRTHKPETINGIEIQEDTPCHIYIPFAHLDPRVVGPNPLEFKPNKQRVQKIFTWNGLESSLGEFPRACPGHDVAIRCLMLAIDYYIPFLEPTVRVNEKEVTRYLDPITQGAVTTTTLRSRNWLNAGEYKMVKASSKDLDFRHYYNFFLPTYDEDFRNNLTGLFDFVAQMVTLVPLIDPISFVSNEEGKSWRAHHLTFFPRSDEEFGDNPDAQNLDEVITRLAFFGLGCHNTTTYEEKSRPGVPGSDTWTFVNDVTPLGQYEVREGFIRYGAAVYFDTQQKPRSIFLSYNGRWVHAPQQKKMSKEWEFAKWVWKVSMFTFVTVHDHLLECHLVKGGALVSAVRQNLSPKNLLRIFLKPFTYHTVYINQLAGRTLIGPNGLADRVFAFHDTVGVLQDLKNNYRYRSKFVNMPNGRLPVHDFPLQKDYVDLLEIVTDYVKKTLALVAGKDVQEAFKFYHALVKELGIDVKIKRDDEFPPPYFVQLLSELIVNGTGIHSQVGQIAEVQVFPNLAGSKLVESMMADPIQAYILNTALTSSTGIDQPKLLDDWSYVLAELKDPVVLQQYFDFKTKLVEMSLRIGSRKTKWEYNCFDPRVLETSVSR